MKKSILTILFFVAVGMYSQNIIKTYTFSTPTIKPCEEYPEYCYVDTDDGYVISALSEPELPSLSVCYYIPKGKEVESVEVSKTGKTSFSLSVPILPRQEPVPTSLDYVPSGFTEPSAEIYGSDVVYPSMIAEVIDEGYMFLTNKVVNVRITPYEYYPLSGRLDFYGSVTVEVKLKDTSFTGNAVAMLSSKTDRTDFYILKRVVDNPENLSAVSERKGSTPICLYTERNSGDCLGYEYVVITSEALAPAFEPLVEWKRRKGLDAGIVTMEYIRENYTGDEISGIYDDAGKLRQFLYESYLHGTVYVLLGGDKDVVPIRYGFNTGRSVSIPTDLYFAEFNGDWDVDGDNKYGESHDDVDYMQEVYIGRILCSYSNEVNNWIEKALIYEQNPGLGDYSYLKKLLLTEADQMQSANRGMEVLSHMPNTEHYIIFREIYNDVANCQSPDTPQHPTGPEVLEEFNKNYGLVSFMGHGSIASVGIATGGLNEWSHYYVRRLYIYDNALEKDSIFETEYSNGGSLSNMRNYNYPNINYSISCDNLDYEYKENVSTHVRGNFGKYCTSGYRAGSVAFLGNTKSGFINLSYNYFYEFCDLVNDGLFSLGIAECLSKVKKSGGDYDYLKFSHNLIGCPEMNMWIDIPKSIDVEINRDDVTGRLSVQLPSPDYKICIMSINYKEQPFQVVASDFTEMTFSNLPSDYTVVVTRDGYLPYVYTVRNNVYLQNIQYNNVQRVIDGYTVTAGYNVDSNHTEGEVIIKGNSKVTIDAESYTEIRNGFNVEKGSVLIIK